MRRQTHANAAKPQEAAMAARNTLSARSAAPQLELAGLDADDGDEQVILTERFLAAARKYIREAGGFDVVASALDKIWGDRGRPVSASVLRAATNGTERNYFRFEWALWFARRSEECGELLLEAMGRGKAAKTPDVELRDLQQVLLEEYPRQAAKLIQRGRAR
jgi:hypothetical protein